MHRREKTAERKKVKIVQYPGRPEREVITSEFAKKMQSGCAKGHEVSCKAPFHGVLRLFSLLGQSPVLHCGVFR